jgi:methylenetetrahydrofolate reductase (NADPH)
MRFSEIYNQSKPILSFEFFPPKKEENLQQTFQMIAELNELSPDFMTVTYGAGGGTRSLTRQMVSYIHNDLQVSAVAHLTCIGHNREELDQVLEKLKSAGIDKILALRGDAPLGNNETNSNQQAFCNARELTEYITKRGDFSVAVAGYPETHRDSQSPEADIEYLKEKVSAGAEIIITQLFFDSDFYFRFLEKTKKAGINIPIVPGIMPIANISQIKRFTEMCGASIPKQLQKNLSDLENQPDQVLQFGIDYATEQCKKLLNGGAPGLHIYTLNRCAQTKPIIENLNL